MSKYVIIRGMSVGNESVGEMWQETKIYDGSATLDEIMEWVMGSELFASHSHKHITITKPHWLKNE